MVVALAASACGGAGGTDPGVDASPPVDATEVDAPPVCMPALPSSMVLAPGATIAPAFMGPAVLTSTGELAVFLYDGANGEAARFWDGTQWTTQPVYTETNGGFGRFAVGEVAGRATLFANLFDQSSDSGMLRTWTQLESGAFATGQRIAGVMTEEARVTRYSPTTQVLSVAGGDQSHTLNSYERNAAGTWTVATVANQPGPGSIYAAGVGTLADGTAAIAGTGTSGFLLYRRTGTSWAQYRTLATGAIYDAHLEFPPAGTTGNAAVGLYQDPITNHPRGVFVDLTTGMASGATDLLQLSDFSPIASEIVYEPGTARGKILLIDGNFQAPRAWIVGFEGTSFAPAQELRPDRVFEARPHLFYHPCGGYQILHVTRAPTDAANTKPLLLESLATFAPGL